MNYHNDTTHISQSGLKLIERAPAHYWQRYLSPDKKEHDTQAFAIGRAFHRATTEPETFFDHYIVSPGKIDRRTKDGKIKWAEFEAAAQGRAILQAASTSEKQRDLDYDTVMKMSESARKHPVGKKFIQAGRGKAEETHYWYDPHTGVGCKCMTDWKANNVIVDLKSTDDASPAGVRRSIKKYGYDFQAAFYLDGLFQSSGGIRHDFIFLFTEKKAPYLSAAYVLTPEDIQAARARYTEALTTYRECLQTGVWPGYPQTIQTVSL